MMSCLRASCTVLEIIHLEQEQEPYPVGTNKQTSKHAGKQASKQVGKQANKQASKQVSKQLSR